MKVRTHLLSDLLNNILNRGKTAAQPAIHPVSPIPLYPYTVFFSLKQYQTKYRGTRTENENIFKI